MDNAIQIGFFILKYVKLRMLEFFYECTSEYFVENSFDLTETDGIYMAINKSSIDQCIKPSHQSKYQKQIFKFCSDNENSIWFPRRCCRRHLFKIIYNSRCSRKPKNIL